MTYIHICYSVHANLRDFSPEFKLEPCFLFDTGKKYDSAFSDLLGKILVPMKLKKNSVTLGRNSTDLRKRSEIFSHIDKVYLFIFDFSANWDCCRSVWNFFSQLGKICYWKPEPVLYRKKCLWSWTFTLGQLK